MLIRVYLFCETSLTLAHKWEQSIWTNSWKELPGLLSTPCDVVIAPAWVSNFLTSTWVRIVIVKLYVSCPFLVLSVVCLGTHLHSHDKASGILSQYVLHFSHSRKFVISRREFPMHALLKFRSFLFRVSEMYLNQIGSAYSVDQQLLWSWAQYNVRTYSADPITVNLTLIRLKQPKRHQFALSYINIA